MATIIHENGKSVEVGPHNGKSFTLSFLQEVVGGYIEPVWLKDGRVMFVNEEGRLKGLPVNEMATMIALTQGVHFAPNDLIVGPAIIVTREEAGETDKPEE